MSVVTFRRLTGREISQNIEDLNNVINIYDLIERTLSPVSAIYTFVANANAIY